MTNQNKDRRKLISVCQHDSVQGAVQVFDRISRIHRNPDSEAVLIDIEVRVVVRDSRFRTAVVAGAYIGIDARNLQNILCEVIAA